MRLVWEWSQLEVDERPPKHPILEIARYLHDPVASRNQGRPSFRLPYPGGTWREEKQRNSHLIRLMEAAWLAATVGIKIKRDQKLEDEEKIVFDLIAEILAAQNKGS